MPELPEVEVIRRGLQAALPGLRIRRLQVTEPRSFIGLSQSTRRKLIGSIVVDVQRRGKLLIVHLASRASQAHPDRGEDGAAPGEAACGKAAPADQALLIHLRMTGQLIFRPAVGLPDPTLAGGYPSQSLIGHLPDRHTRVQVSFDDGSRLYFNDQRKFGHMKLTDLGRLADDGFLSRLGPEPLDEGFGWRELRDALGSGRLSVKAALLDQGRLAGIGNIYADESLFRARIDPRRSVASLSAQEHKQLASAIRECLGLAIAAGGSTARDYVDSQGLRGEFLDLYAAVYGREGQPCPRCGQPVTKTRVAGRGTHLCERCQS
jgi:formamidopyrimidine-DNA glycosylase